MWGAKTSVLPANHRFLEARTEFWHPTRNFLAAERARGDRGRRNGDAEALQFADDPSVAPARVLACEPENKRLYLTIECWPPRGSVRVSPAPPDKLAVPAQQRRRT